MAGLPDGRRSNGAGGTDRAEVQELVASAQLGECRGASAEVENGGVAGALIS